MGIRVLFDADALSKLVRWDLAASALKVLGASGSECATLGTLRYRFHLDHPQKAAKRCGSAAAAGRLEAVLKTFSSAPSPSVEVMNELANREGVDAGEAVLVGQLAVLEDAVLVTGDKKAITALGAVNPAIKSKYSGRIICLEQLILQMIDAQGLAPIQSAIRSDPACDKAIAIVFGSTADAPAESVTQGLQSYISNLRGLAPGVLRAS